MSMSYFSYSEDQSLGGSLGCGPSCSCGPCRSGLSGFAERYEKEQEAESPAPPPPPRPAPSQSAGSLKGWHGLGYAELPGPTTAMVSPAPAVGSEQAVLQDALRRGIRNPRRLANILFYTRHPSRLGTPILANEAALIAEWRQILEQIVLPALGQTPGPPNTPVAPFTVRPPRRRYY
jgi:hypothetical protein